MTGAKFLDHCGCGHERENHAKDGGGPCTADNRGASLVSIPCRCQRFLSRRDAARQRKALDREYGETA